VEKLVGTVLLGSQIELSAAIELLPVSFQLLVFLIGNEAALSNVRRPVIVCIGFNVWTSAWKDNPLHNK
jgi:hypothetical protein